jgi:hypothetical protein
MTKHVKRYIHFSARSNIVIDMNTKTQSEINERIYRWRASKNARGWKYINLLLPPEVKEKVMVYKQTLMEQYRNNVKQ